jgi:peptidoglycan/LPS O-acetylase OafA/YrhL
MYLKHTYLSHLAMQGLGISDLLTGRSFQLWFLPFLMLLGQFMFFPCQKAARLNRSAQYWIAAVLFIAGCAMALAPRFSAVDTSSAFFQCSYFLCLSWDALPSALWGIALALVMRETPVPENLAWRSLAVAVGGGAIVNLWQRNILLETVAGAALLGFALSAGDGRFSRALSHYAFLAYGIYLAQGVVLETIQALAGRAGVPTTGVTEVGVFLVTAVLCASISVALARSKLTRWMLG